MLFPLYRVSMGMPYIFRNNTTMPYSNHASISVLLYKNVYVFFFKK